MICQSILTMFAFSYSQKLEAETADSNTTANSGYFILRRISHSNIFMRINLRYFGKKKDSFDNRLSRNPNRPIPRVKYFSSVY